MSSPAAPCSTLQQETEATHHTHTPQKREIEDLRAVVDAQRQEIEALRQILHETHLRASRVVMDYTINGV